MCFPVPSSGASAQESLTRLGSDAGSNLQMQPLRMGVIDGHPYVRRTAVMGVLKVYNLDSNAVKNAGQSFLSCPRSSGLAVSTPGFFKFFCLSDSCATYMPGSTLCLPKT